MDLGWALAFLALLILNLLILGLWHRYRKKKGKELPWYWGWILPSDIFTLTLLALIGSAATAKFAIETFPLKEKRTLKEMIEIKRSIIKYHRDTNNYPSSLQKLIEHKPLRKKWKFDSWNTEYKLTYQKQRILDITSAGPDRAFDTEDDLKIEIAN